MKNLFVCFLVVMLLASCGWHPQPPGQDAEWNEFLDERDRKADLASVDEAIRAEEARIILIRSDMEEFIEAGKNGAKVAKVVEGLKHDIVRANRKIKKLNAKKAKLLEQGKVSCFPAETFIQTGNNRLIPISRIKVGDTVMTFDIGTQTNILRKVLCTYKDNNNHYYIINNAIKATAYERFLTANGWKKVMNLKKGDTIQTYQGKEVVDSLIIKNGELEVYNLQVDESHTFYVTGSGGTLYLVHNSGSGSK